MTRFVTILFIILFSSCSIPRTLDGDYFESFGEGWGGATFTFHKNGHFECKGQYDVGGYEGSGNYKIVNKKLKMKFSGDSLDTTNSFIQTLTFKSKSDWQIHLIVKSDTSNEKLPFAIVLLYDSTGKKLTGTTTDTGGATTINLNSYSGIVNVSIQYIGYKTCAIQLKNQGNYELEARLFYNLFYETIPAKAKWKYRILFFEKDQSFFNIKPIGKNTDPGIDRSVRRLDKLYKL